MTNFVVLHKEHRLALRDYTLCYSHLPPDGATITSSMALSTFWVIFQNGLIFVLYLHPVVLIAYGDHLKHCPLI